MEGPIAPEFNDSTSPSHEMLTGALQWYHYVWIVSGICGLAACVTSVWIIVKHLLHYNEPKIQLYIVRIIIMIPVYSIDSVLSLIFRDYSLYFNIARDCYEAYVLYQFFRLLIEFAHGDDELAAKMDHVPQMKYACPLCCFHVKPNRIFLHRCQQMILQFVYAKVTLAIITFVTELFEVYAEGNFAANRAYLYVTIVYNVSITISLYFLVLFYEATKEILAEYKPISKFLCIKAVIFFSFWQGVAIAILVHWGILIKAAGDWTAEEIAILVQNALICVEMFPIAIAFALTFGHQSFKIPLAQRAHNEEYEKSRAARIIGNFAKVANVTDVFRDTKSAIRKEPARQAVTAYGFFKLSREDQLQQILEKGWLKKKRRRFS